MQAIKNADNVKSLK